ncbi:MAG: PQQ-dependent dehydrogenase, methanol/ethanol family [Kangiellaceae bacterium]|nr:PQQ-dependent dehydrogenase, methanol/ethanol family [Kangiellaceae bacterium]
MLKNNPWRLFILGLCFANSGCENPDNKPVASTKIYSTGVEQVSDASDWPLNGLTYGEQRHSPLTQINKDNVKDIGLAWRFDDFVVRGRVHRGNQGTPLVIDGVMYFTGPWSVVYASDAKTGALLWQYDPQVEGAWARKACCDVNNKGVAVWQGKVYVGTVDGYLDAVDIKTGKRIWRVDTLTDRTRSYTVTGAPRIAGKNIVIGNGGSDMDARGFITAFDLETGEKAWRFFTVPGDPKYGDEHPELTEARKTWGEDSRWDLGGGGTVYDSMVYDPELDLIYAGTSNGVPHPAWLRDPTEGDNLYLSSIIAVNATTGRMKWHYQTTPADSWDFGSTQNMILTDLDINGERRKILMQAPKNGFFYVLDRETGELISAENFTIVTWAESIDMKTGRPIFNKAEDYRDSPKIIWPSVSGGHNWQPMAYNEQTKLAYIPVLEAPMKYVAYESVVYQPASLNEGKGPPLMPPFEKSDDHLIGKHKPKEHSVLKAWDPVTQKVVWESAPQTWWSGGVLSTASGLILQGAVDGTFTVYDAQNGTVLKVIDTGIAMLAPPMSYMVDGEQYIAVLGGLGGSESAYYPKRSAARKYENPETLFVFKLGGDEITKPAIKKIADKQPLPPAVITTPEQLESGAEMFFHHCARCHSYRGSKGSYPNLWNMAPGIHQVFDSVVLDGAFSYAGMSGFKDVLSKQDSDAIYGYIINDLHEMVNKGEEADTGSRIFMENKQD